MNQYGITASPLHGGLPTDRCVAEWWVGKPAGRSRRSPGAAGRPCEPPTAAHLVPRRYRRASAREDPERAREIQTRECASSSAARSTTAWRSSGFERSETEGTYLLEPWP